MPHIVVISLTQAFALLMSGLLVWGMIKVNTLNACIVGEANFCIVDSLLLTLMAATAFLLIAFTIGLFKAYSD